VKSDGAQLISLMNKNGWCDAFDIAGEGSRWTFYHRNGQVKNRIDYWLIPKDLLADLVSVKSIPSVWSDHCILLLEENSSSFQFGKDLWRLNRAILT
jgi:exonuclease III